MTRALATAGGVSITVDDLLLTLKLALDSPVLTDLLLRKMAAARAESEGLSVTDDDLDEALAEFYAERDLFEEKQVTAWLAQVRLDEEAVKRHVRETLLVETLKTHVVPDDAVTARFRSSPHDYATAHVEVIELASQGAASEIALQVKEGEITWAEATRRAGGMRAETLQRSEAPEEIAALLFTAEPGRLVGPAETEEGRHAVYRVLSKSEPQLDEELMEQIRDALFNDELSRALARQPLRFL